METSLISVNGATSVFELVLEHVSMFAVKLELELGLELDLKLGLTLELELDLSHMLF